MDQRYYASSYGRFNTADQYQASAGPSDPGSWNRYAYVGGDPINYADPNGRQAVMCNGGGGAGNADGFFGNPCWGAGGPFDPCMDIFGDAGFCKGGNPVSPVAIFPPEISCEGTEIAFVTAYLSRYKSPLAAFAAEIVSDADAAGIDDRFIVALAGRETTYGTLPTWNSASAGIYNVFSNSQHCAAPGLSMCAVFSPYSSYNSAIADVVATINNPKYYAGLNSADDIYNEYNHGGLSNPKTGVPYGPDKILDDIYGSSRLAGNLNNVRSPRCP